MWPCVDSASLQSYVAHGNEHTEVTTKLSYVGRFIYTVSNKVLSTWICRPMSISRVTRTEIFSSTHGNRTIYHIYYTQKKAIMWEGQLKLISSSDNRLEPYWKKKKALVQRNLRDDVDRRWEGGWVHAERRRVKRLVENNTTAKAVGNLTLVRWNY